MIVLITSALNVCWLFIFLNKLDIWIVLMQKLVGCKQLGEEILKSVESHVPAAAAV